MAEQSPDYIISITIEIRLKFDISFIVTILLSNYIMVKFMSKIGVESI
jgi:hypothetical protein